MPSLTITLIQSDIFWEDKKANLKSFSQKINSITERSQLIVLPEMFSTGFSADTDLAESEEDITLNWMRQTCITKGVALIGSLMIKEKDNYFNRCYCVLPNGHYRSYDKRHLFPLGEEASRFTRGNKRLICSINGWKLCLQICYDLRFPVWCRQQNSEGIPEYDVLLNIANWPLKREDLWHALLKARAIENQCFSVGLNRIGKDGNGIVYNGGSCVFDPLGVQIHDIYNTEAVYTFTLHKEELEKIRTDFPFLSDADFFFIQ